MFPPIEPYQTHQLAVTPPHRLYIEECGNPDGIPVIFIHGGPGSGCEPWHRTFFDPDRYHIILFDQRGSGRSTPHADLTNNTTQDLVADMETIREHLSIDQWLVFGGSWGSTLGLVYAQTHPACVTGLILRGIFLCREREIDWFYRDGASRIFPDYWHDYLAPIKHLDETDYVRAYYQCLTSDNEVERMRAALAWSTWEGRCATLAQDDLVLGHYTESHTAVSLARIECHYFINQSFLRPNQILEDASKLQDIPGIVVQGRYDLICPMESAWALDQAWPNADLRIINDAGHSAAETGICRALLEACNEFADRLTA